jgi:hypothetical protein
MTDSERKKTVTRKVETIFDIKNGPALLRRLPVDEMPHVGEQVQLMGSSPTIAGTWFTVTGVRRVSALDMDLLESVDVTLSAAKE